MGRTNETMDRLLEVEMDPALLHGGAREQWEAISDLDAFFRHVYNYFHERGMRCILASRVISLLVLAFTMLFTVWLVECMNWHGLLYACVDETSCATVRLVREDAFRSPSPFLVFYLILFTLYWLWSFAHFLWDLCPLLEMQSFFRNKLRIDDQDLQATLTPTRPARQPRRAGHDSRPAQPEGPRTFDAQVIPWDTVVQRVVELQRTVRLCIVKDQLTAHDIANRILRKENFMVALINHGLLPLQASRHLACCCCFTRGTLRGVCARGCMVGSGGNAGLMSLLRPRCTAHASLMLAVCAQPVSLFPSFNVMTKTLEWNLYATIIDAMFDAQFRIRQTFTQDVSSLRRRLFLCGVFNMLLSPFIGAFMLVFFFLKHAEEFHRSPGAPTITFIT